jgi:hypothetical protein
MAAMRRGGTGWTRMYRCLLLVEAASTPSSVTQSGQGPASWREYIVGDLKTMPKVRLRIRLCERLKL